MRTDHITSRMSLSKDLPAGLVVFFVALPLCLGIALASGAPLFSGILSGIVGGLVVGWISGSHTSVSGPAAGLTAIVASRIQTHNAFEVFLLGVVMAGLLQIAMGLIRAGSLSAFFPSSVIKGLLAAIGVLLILKQIPHLLGHDSDPDGEMAFTQPDHENTFSEIGRLFLGEIHYGSLAIGAISIILLITWERIKALKQSAIPSPLVVVVLGGLLVAFLEGSGDGWQVEASHRVQVPVASSLKDAANFFRFPDFSHWNDAAVLYTAIVIAIVASLETLLNLEAVDKIDRRQRRSPPNRELIAQGIGNITGGMLGAIPVTSVIVRSSVNINAGAESKQSTIFHGCLLAASVAFVPRILNEIPLSCLAAILIVTGFKLAGPELFRQMYREGRYQFIPFVVTLVAIILTDLMIGIGIGLAVSAAFILNSNFRRPISCVVERYPSGDVLHVQLANQVSFLNRAALENTLYNAPPGTHVLIDAASSDYIDPDILSLVRDFQERSSKVRGVAVSTKGFRSKFNIPDNISFDDYTTERLQKLLTPLQVLEILCEGNYRFRTGNHIVRDFGRQVNATSVGQHPLAVVFTCIDSRSPAELIFDTGIGDIFTIRIAGNVVRSKVLGSMEYACAVAGAKLILVMGHTRCGAVNATLDLVCSGKTTEQATGCGHLDLIVEEISHSIDADRCRRVPAMTDDAKKDYADEIAMKHVERSTSLVVRDSDTIRRLIEEGRVAVAGAMYNISTGKIEFIRAAMFGFNEDVDTILAKTQAETTASRKEDEAH